MFPPLGQNKSIAIAARQREQRQHGTFFCLRAYILNERIGPPMREGSEPVTLKMLRFSAVSNFPTDVVGDARPNALKRHSDPIKVGDPNNLRSLSIQARFASVGSSAD